MFTGFSDATIDFLWELRFHNEPRGFWSTSRSLSTRSTAR